MTQPRTIHLKEYQPPAHYVESVELYFDLGEERTVVRSKMRMHGDAARPLKLNGERLQLDSIRLDGRDLDATQYLLDDESLVVHHVPERFELEIVTTILPHLNTALEGLYKSGEIFCTQNEPEGFRRITYFVDRPDNMSVYTTTIAADRELYPVLLSNGNLQAAGSLEDGRHFATWHDPFAKPSYLFALVAGNLGSISDRFTTLSGRSVELNIYCDRGNESKCAHAMRSLKASMQWDEEVYGREYDLDIYNIVAVDSFNMGAMENKGLNIFNSHYVLADEDTATDQDFLGIESVIAHEYFHNWTGNRITCRDWFQLTLKEGLTVFRDQCFSADMHSESVQRIRDVQALRERQFVEDAGPTAHPIKPESYIEINNFYTATVYEKGAEVIRMIHTMLGPNRFRDATDLYFRTFDGQAVRTEDFLWAMEEGGGIDLTQFRRWYAQERTPGLEVGESFDADAQCFSLTLTQVVPESVEGRPQLPYAYPLAFGLLDSGGEALRPVLRDASAQPLIDRGILMVSRERETFVFEGVKQRPRVSLNRRFSAPIKLHHLEADYPFLMRHDRDGFNRFEAAQAYAMQMLETLQNGGGVDGAYLVAYEAILDDEAIDPLFKSQLLQLPSISRMMQSQPSIDFEALYGARDRLRHVIAEAFATKMSAMYRRNHVPSDATIDGPSVGKRALKNRLLGFLAVLGSDEYAQLCLSQYETSVTMTDRLAALDLLENHAPEAAEKALKHFYERYRRDTLVMNKYFSVLSASERDGTIERVRALEADPAFNIQVPNLVRSLFGVFARNHRHFHAKDGSGYRLIADKVLQLDGINPMIASGLAGAFKTYRKLIPANRELMKAELERILKAESLSNNVYEIVEKTLHH